MRDFFLGGDVDLIENYKSFLNAQDIRKNAFELSLSNRLFFITPQIVLISFEITMILLQP